jgi:EAL domain-containing protein (putative c-di-GMP-specific phosphodiesterase class I)
LNSFVEPHFQSIVVNGSCEVYAAEALCRIRNSGALPSSLIKMWERSGFMANIDLAMIRSLKALFARRPEPVDCRIAVNVSARTIESAGAACLDALRELAPLARRVIVEITETYSPSDWRVVTDFSLQVKENGMHVALDDCAPSNIFWERNFVKVVAPRLLKLDGDLLHECFESGNPDQILRLMDLANRVGALVVAERVDSERKNEFAASHGINLMQGWFYDKAAPPAHEFPRTIIANMARA